MNPDISLAISKMLQAEAEIAAMIGQDVYIQRLPQNVNGSAIVLWTISEIPYLDMGGSIGMDRAIVQINAYSDTLQDAGKLSWLVWTKLDGKVGVFEGVQIVGLTRQTGVRQSADRVQFGTDQYRFLAAQDLVITYCSDKTVGG